MPDWKPVDRVHLDCRGPVTPDGWNTFACDLLGRLGGDVSAKGLPTWVAVHQPDDGPSGALAIHESETELMGWTAPPECAAVGVVAAGRVVDHTGSGSGGAALRITLCCLVARDGRLGWWAAPVGAVPATPPEEGRVVDCLRRCMGLPTFPPPSGPEVLLDVMWLHEVDRVAGGRVGSRLSWDEVRGLHPAANDPAGPLPPWWTWGEIRSATSNGAWPDGPVSASLAAWMDEGMFARAVLETLPDIETLFSAISAALTPDARRRLARHL